MKQIELKNDIWSQRFISYLKTLPHYATACLWNENIDIAMEDTPYYNWLLHTLNTQWSVWGILKTHDDIVKQYNKFKEVFLTYENWKGECFDPTRITKQVINGMTYFYGSLPVKVDGNGDFYLWDGQHRIAVLLAKKHSNIKIIICDRFPEWQNIVTRLESLYPTHVLYQPIDHPEFQDWSASRDDEKEQVLSNIIQANNITKVIDLGCCHGYTLYNLKSFLQSAIGVEYNQDRYNIANIVLKNCKFTCVNKDIYDFVNSVIYHPDCILALSVFHHFMRQNPIEQFEKLLKRIAILTNTLIYELPHKDEEQYHWMYQIPIEQYISEKTGFTKTEIYPLTSKRNIIKISK